MKISSVWDSGFRVQLGDQLNGFVDEANVPAWAEVEAWLRAAAAKHYPKSEFAKVEGKHGVPHAA
jgi:hypothetical protein